MIVGSHARRLIASLDAFEGQSLTLEKRFGETAIVESANLERPGWQWFER